MTTWVALFRGINVGGNNILPMKDLAAMLEAIGCTDVRTYIQSGNVIFRKPGSEASQLAKTIGKSVLTSYGFESKVQLLTARELERAVKSNPFTEAEEDPKSLHVLFLVEKPESPDLKSLNEIKSESESYSLHGNLFYLHAPEGIGRSRLAAKAEKLLGVDATGRNWRTVSKLLELVRHCGRSKRGGT
jgi:uncharacterized protein (DUF1697 family)